ncbi:hypothetical protein [Paraburkholderia caribensis]|uniref:hypothetical protein n=1 Tax=Paraburkholderia caribensis TaxID=75105 RepID=UPI0034D33757
MSETPEIPTTGTSLNRSFSTVLRILCVLTFTLHQVYGATCNDVRVVDEPSTIGGEFSLSRDASLIVTDSADRFGEPVEVTVRDVISGDAIRRWSFPNERVRSLCFLGKSHLIAMGTDQEVVRVLNPETGEIISRKTGADSPVAQYQCPSEGGLTVSDLAFPDGFVGWWSDGLQPTGHFTTPARAVLDATATTGDRALVLLREASASNSTPEGGLEAAKSSGAQGAEFKYSVAWVGSSGNQILWRLQLGESPARSLAVDDQGRTGAWISESGNLHLIDLATGKERYTMQLATGPYPRLMFSSGGEYLGIFDGGSGWRSIFVDVRSRKVVRETKDYFVAMGSNGYPTARRALDKEDIEIAGDSGSSSTPLSIRSRVQNPTLIRNATGTWLVNGQGFDYLIDSQNIGIVPLIKPDGIEATLAVRLGEATDPTRIFQRSDDSILILPKAGQQIVPTMPSSLKAVSTAGLPDGSGVLVAAVEDNDLQQLKSAVTKWSNAIPDNGEGKEMIRIFEKTRSALYAINFDGHAEQLLDVRGAITALAVTRDLRTVALAQSTNIQVIDLRSRRTIFTLPQPSADGLMTSLRVSENHPWIAYAYGKTVEVRNWTTGEVVKQIVRKHEGQDAFEFSSDGKTLLYADGPSIQSVVLSAGAPQGSAKESESIYEGAGAIVDLIPPYSRFISAVSTTGAVYFWKTGQSQPVARILFDRNGDWTVVDAKNRWDTGASSGSNSIHFFTDVDTAPAVQRSDCAESLRVHSLLNALLNNK